MTNLSSAEHQIQADLNTDPYDFSESEAQPDAVVYSSDESTQAAQSKSKPLKKRPYPMPAVTEEAAPVQNAASVSNSTGASPLSVASDSPLTEDAASSPNLLAKRKRKNSRVQRVEGGMGVNISVSCDPPTVPTQTPPQPSPATLLSPSTVALINDLRSIIASAQPTAPLESQSPISSRTRSSNMVQQILSRNPKLPPPPVAKSPKTKSSPETPAVKRGRGRPPREPPTPEQAAQSVQQQQQQPESPRRGRRPASSKRAPPLDPGASSEAALADAKTSGLMLRIKTKFVQETVTEEGLHWRIDDVCWGKVLGYPWWPARIGQIQECNRYTNESLSPAEPSPSPSQSQPQSASNDAAAATAAADDVAASSEAAAAAGVASTSEAGAPRARVQVSTTASALLLWFGSNTRSWVPCAELRPFLAEFSQRCDARRSKGKSRSANYMRAVRDAQAAARRPPGDSTPSTSASLSAPATSEPLSPTRAPPAEALHTNTNVTDGLNEPPLVPSVTPVHLQAVAENAREDVATIEWSDTDTLAESTVHSPSEESPPAAVASLSTASNLEHPVSSAPQSITKSLSQTNASPSSEVGEHETLRVPLPSSSQSHAPVIIKPTDLPASTGIA